MPRMVFTTTDSIDAARSLARKIVEEKKAACVSIIPGIVSVYRWKGSVREEKEYMLVCKTSDDAVEELKLLIMQSHSYELPEVTVADISGGSERYLKWIEESCN